MLNVKSLVTVDKTDRPDHACATARFLAAIYAPIGRDLARVETELKKQLRAIGTESPTPEARQIIGYFFNLPGKRLRPALTVLAVRAAAPQRSRPGARAGAAHTALIRLAAAVELVHSASLIHDDIIDHAAFRRDQLTLNKKHGNHLAVLVGDLLYAQAFSALISLPLTEEKRKTAILEIVCRTTKLMCVGEIGELKDGPRNTLAGYLQTMEHKTASFMAACCRCGAILAGTEKKFGRALETYGLNFGMAYQLVDDYLDVEEDKAVPAILLPEAQLRSAAEYTARAKQALRELPESTARQQLSDLADYTMRLAQSGHPQQEKN